MRSKTMIFLVLAGIVAVSLMAGCTGKNVSDDPKMEEIDTGLGKGPVFAEFGAGWCSWCTLEKTVIEDLYRNYTSVTYMEVDVDSQNGSALADAFYVDGIPQMAIIARKNADGSYLYIDPAGNSTTDRFKSRIIGFRKYDQLKPLLEAALAAR